MITSYGVPAAIEELSPALEAAHEAIPDESFLVTPAVEHELWDEQSWKQLTSGDALGIARKGSPS